jgi:hypothetical protein
MLFPERMMLGPPKPRRLDEPVAVSLEVLVPRENFSRHLEAKLDLGFVREWTRELSAERGRPGIDPVVVFKLQLVLFFEGIRSERKLVETASLHLAHRWYLGYALDEDLPLRRFRLRGPANVNIEGLLVAAGQNLKRLVAAMGWGRRHAPCGSLPAPPRTLLRPTVAPG